MVKLLELGLHDPNLIPSFYKTLKTPSIREYKLQQAALIEKLKRTKQKQLENRTKFDVEFGALCAMIDKNHDDKIQVGELATIYPNAAATFFSQLDKNHDSVLDRFEFREMFVLADGSLDLEKVKEIRETLKKNMAADSEADTSDVENGATSETFHKLVSPAFQQQDDPDAGPNFESSPVIAPFNVDLSSVLIHE